MTADPHLRRSPLAGVEGVREIPFRTMINVRTTQPLLGVPLPEPNRVRTVGERAILWLGPDEYLIVAPDGDDVAGLEAESVVDVSANRTTIELSGPHARDVLEKGMPIDLHPRAFGPGDCAQTLLARAQVLVRQVDAKPTYHVLVRGSFARYLADWLVDASKEFE